MIRLRGVGVDVLARSLEMRNQIGERVASDVAAERDAHDAFFAEQLLVVDDA